MCRIFCQLSCLDEIPVVNFLPLFRLAPEFKALHLYQLDWSCRTFHSSEHCCVGKLHCSEEQCNVQAELEVVIT